MIIGEAPDHVEVRNGHPFVGETRGVVDLFLKKIGVTRENVYLTTALKCMLPDSRKPADAELRHCQGWLDAEIRKQDPRVILAMGKSAARMLIRRKNIESLRNREWFYRSIPVIVTYHPIVFMRRSQKRRDIMQDIASVRRKLNRIRLEKQGNYSANAWMLG